MPILERDEFCAAVSGRGRLLGMDPGTKTLGLALSDPGQMIASPLETIPRTQWKKDKQRLLAIMQEFAIQGIVIGYPLNMDGSGGSRTQSVAQLAKNIITLQDMPVLLWDERQSTMAVERVMLQGDLSRAKRAKHIDKLAASYILQGVLDYRPQCS